MNVEQARRSFYDPEAIRCIPILDVCDRLGIRVEKRGRNYWCKVRPERTASVILHPDRNTFYDFGNQEKGGVIGLVHYATGRSIRDSVQFLAEAFDIKPCTSRNEVLSKPLTNWEYARIGLQGDMVTKNFVFPIETATLAELAELASMFRMSMNELRKESPSVYEAILLDRAIPYVDELRNNYYCQVWNHYDFLCTFGHGTDFFDSDRTRGKFEARTAELERAERLLYKAGHDTGLEIPMPQHYDPLHVVSLIMQGRLSISLGVLEPRELLDEAERLGAGTEQIKVSYDVYFQLKLQDIEHSAEFTAGEVTVTYLDRDSDTVATCLHLATTSHKEALDEQITKASRQTKATTGKTQERNEPVLN